MRHAWFVRLSLILLAPAPVWAGEGLTRGGAVSSQWSLVSTESGTSLPMTGGFSIGVSKPVHEGVPCQDLQSGGYLAWSGIGTRVDATLRPALGGGVALDLGASTGDEPGLPGTRYSLRVGTAWTGESLHLSPRFSLNEPHDSDSGVNVSVAISYAIRPGLSFTGSAVAGRVSSNANDNSSSQLRFILGAGMGLRF